MPTPTPDLSLIPISESTAIAATKSTYFDLISQVTTPATGIVVSSPEEYDAADSRLSRVRETKKSVQLKLEEEIRPRYLTLESWYSLQRELIGPIDAAEKSLKHKMADYQLRLARQKAEADRIRDEETRRLSQEAQKALTAANNPQLSAVDRARAKFQATKAVTQAQEVKEVVSIPEVKGTSSTFIPTESWKVTDLKAFLQGVINGTVPLECVQVQVVNMNMFWKMNRERVKGWPGVVVESGGRIAGR